MECSPLYSVTLNAYNFQRNPSHLKLEMKGIEEMEETPTFHPLFHLSHFSLRGLGSNEGSLPNLFLRYRAQFISAIEGVTNSV